MSGDGYVQHDCAIALTKAIVEIFEPILRPEEVRDAIDTVYVAVKAALTAYDAQRDHVLKPLKPMNN